MVTVCTVLPVPERPRIDAVGDGCFDTLHAESLRCRSILAGLLLLRKEHLVAGRP